MPARAGPSTRWIIDPEAPGFRDRDIGPAANFYRRLGTPFRAKATRRITKLFDVSQSSALPIRVDNQSPGQDPGKVALQRFPPSEGISQARQDGPIPSTLGHALHLIAAPRADRERIMLVRRNFAPRMLLRIYPKKQS